MAPSLPWAILWCLNLCIICHLAFYPCGSKKPTASSVLAAPQCFQYNNSGKLTGSHNVAWLLRTPTVEFALLFSLPVSALQNVPISTCPSLCFCVSFNRELSSVSLSSPFYPLFLCLSVSVCILLWNSLIVELFKLNPVFKIVIKLITLNDSSQVLICPTHQMARVQQNISADISDNTDLSVLRNTLWEVPWVPWS